MRAFDYLSLVTSLVLGLGITRTLTGFGRLLQARHMVKLYWVHLVWSLNLFLVMTLNWWVLYRWNDWDGWSFFLFLFILLSPTVAFLLSVLLFPEPMQDGIDLKQHYFANHRWFFTIAALLPLIDAVDTLLKGWDHFVTQGLVYPVFLAVVFVLSVHAARTRDERYHRFFAVFFLLYLLLFILINLLVLG